MSVFKWEKQPHESLRVLVGEDTCDTRRVIALVGAGGKTSLMYALAREFVEIGRGVICTTTTRIFPPTPEQCRERLLLDGYATGLEVADRIVASFLRLNERLMTVASQEDPATGKWIGLPADWVDALSERVPAGTVILVEADGSARHSLKAPARHEPVLPERTDCCLGVLGLDAIGKGFDAMTTHRIEHAVQITGQAYGSRVNGETLAGLVNHQDGIFRPKKGIRRVVLCNKLDVESDGDLWEAAKQASVAASGSFWDRHPEYGTPPIWYAGSVREGFCLFLSSASKPCQSEVRECTGSS